MSNSLLLTMIGGCCAIGRHRLTFSPSVITSAQSGGVPDDGVVGPVGVVCPVDVISSGPYSGLFASAWGCIAAV